MPPSDYLSLRQNQAHLKVMAVLRKWDPIGVICEQNQDEYDGYSVEIVHMLDAAVTVQQLVDHLRWIVERMEIQFDEATARDCANELINYWPTRPR
jgi:hypothetical protein